MIGKILLEQFSPLFLTATRIFFILIFLVIYTGVARRISSVNRLDLFWLALLGIIGVWINHLSFYEGLVTADPTTSALILALTPIVTSFLAAIFLKERLTPRSFIGSIIATVGVFFVIYNGEQLQFDFGLVWIFGTMLSFSISIILVRKIGQRMNPVVTTLYSTLFGFGILLPQLGFSSQTLVVSGELWAWALLAFSAVLMHGVCTLIWNRQLQIVGATQASIFSNLEPFITMVFSFVLLNKLVTFTQIVGGLLIVMGVLLTTLFSAKKLIG